jgi:hypothetical protein
MAFKMWAPMTALARLLVVSGSPSASASAIVTEWLDQTIPAAKQTAWEPTVGARFFALVHAAMYDAWTAYDPVAVGVFSGTALRGKGGPATVANKREAISHAAYQVLRELAPVRRRALAEYMAGLGYDLNATSSAAIVGRRAGQAALAATRDDGANQASNYQDTSGYRVAEPPTASSWQPIDELGSPQLPVSPHWGRVMTFALRSADEFRPVPPPRAAIRRRQSRAGRFRPLRDGGDQDRRQYRFHQALRKRRTAAHGAWIPSNQPDVALCGATSGEQPHRDLRGPSGLRPQRRARFQ